MRHVRQHMFGCGHCAPCAAAKFVSPFFAGFLTLALTFAISLILSSVMFTNTAFAQVGTQNNTSAEVAKTATAASNTSKETAGQSNSSATTSAGNSSANANAALSQNSTSTSKNSENAASFNAANTSGASVSAASISAQNSATNSASGSASATSTTASASDAQTKPVTFSITYVVDGQSATTEGVAGTIKLATLESKVVDGISYTFLGWKLEDGTLLEGGTDFEMTENVTLTAEWKIEAVGDLMQSDQMADQDSSNSVISGENEKSPVQSDLSDVKGSSQSSNAPGYVVLPDDGEPDSQVGNDNSSLNNQTTTTTPPQNQNGTATSSTDQGTTLPDSSDGSASASQNQNSSSTKDLTASPNAPPVDAPDNSSSSSTGEQDATQPDATQPDTTQSSATQSDASQSSAQTSTSQSLASQATTSQPSRSSQSLTTQATPTENPFSATLTNVYWSWDPTTGTLTIGNIGTNTATINIGAFTASTLPWLTAADGAAPQAIKHIITKQNAYGGKITCDSFEGWFENYTALLSFDGMGLAITNSTSFARMFKGCVNLTSITGISEWHAEDATDYSEMFSGCSSLESLDLSVYVTADKPATGTGTVTRNRTDMLAGMTSLKSLRLGTMTSLADTGLDAISTRIDKLGIWDAEQKVADEDAKWSGASSLLVARYPLAGGISSNNATITDVIDYIFHPCGTFDSNNKVNWDFNTTTSTLTIFASEGALPTETLVTEAVMPWLSAIDKNTIKYVSFLTKTTGGASLSKVLFSTLAGVFEGYVNMLAFDGSGLNTTSVNDFSNLFKGDTALTTINLSGWSMRDQRDANNLTLSGMFEGCTALNTLTVGKDVVLFVDVNNHAGIDGLYARGDNDGVWERTDSTTNDPWFGTSANLEKRYSSNTLYVDRGDAVYTFTTAYRGGRFDNDNTWWKYTVGANQKTLTIGADLLEPGETGDYRIAKIERDDLPWLKLVNGQPIVDITQITYITTVGSTVGNMIGMAAPLYMAHWFEGFTSLVNFNGSNLNTQYCTDFTDLFKGDTKLISINLAGWDTSASSTATRAGMFDGCTALLTLTVGPNVELTGTGLEILADHTTDDGAWVRQDSTTDSWMGSSENLVNRYNGPTSEGAGLGDEPAIYYFDDSILRNVFQSNANVWWQYDKDEKTLTIGVNMANVSSEVSETYDTVPWLAVLGKGSADPAQTARELIAHIDFKQLVEVLNPAMWFKGYINLEDAYVANLGVSQAISIASIFEGCTKLKILNGLGSWNTSNVTNMSHAFDGCNFTDPGSLENWNDKVGNVTDLSYMFANNGSVTTLDCVKDWILSSATNFAYTFANCSRLVSLDISGWDMGKATTSASRENMLYGLDRLTTLTLSNTSNLEDAGLGKTDGDVARGDTNGTWEANRVTNTLVGTAENAWFGTSDDLMRRYTPSRYPAGFNLGDDIIYTWKPGVYGGRMPQAEPNNPYEDLWWKFVKGTDDATGRNTGTLTIGTDAPGGTNLTLTPDTAPWVDLIWRIYGDANAKAGLVHVTHFIAQVGKALPANLLLSADSLTGLFALDLGYTGLTRFNGAGFDVSNVTSLAHLFDGVSTLTQVMGIENWKTGNVTDLSYMFANNTKLTTITSIVPDGTKATWDVRNVRDFSHMFENCTSLTELTAFATWAVSPGSNFAYMFSGCSNLTTLDIWGWDMSNATSLDHMLADLESITTLGVGSKTALEGANFEDIATRQKKHGSWDRQGSTWFGNTQNIVLLYPANLAGLGNALGDKIYYTWAEGILRGRFESNDNAYWSVTWNGTPWTATGILTIGVDNPAGNRVVTETWEQTPWTEALSTEGTRDGNNLITFITMERGITPANFAFWFANYANLTDFNSRADNDELGLDVSQTTSLEGLFQNDRKLSIVGNIYDWDVDQVTNFDSLFENCESLYVVDIHKWIMGPNATTSHVNMLKGTDSLRTLILNGNISLKDSGLDDATSNPNHAETKGSWLRIKEGTAAAYNTDPWFGSSANLINRYYEHTNIHGSGDGEGAIYTWTDQLRGRFDDNDNTWWSYDSNRKILTMGVDAAELNETLDPATAYRVSATAGALPWERALPTIKQVVLEIYAVLNGTLSLCPTSMEGWFQNYTALTSFNGTNFDTSLLTSGTASLDNLFNGCTSLRTLNLTNWNWQGTGVSHVDMFKNLNSITKITLETGAALDGTGFDTIGTRQNTQGRWVMETELTGASAADIPWFDSSEKLVYRYPGTSAGAVVAKVGGVWTVLDLLAGIHTYTWNTPILGGRFEDNPNAWWMFYKETVNDIVAGTLVIGTDDKDPASTYGIEVSVRGSATGTTAGDGTTSYTYDSSALPWYSALGGNVAGLNRVLYVLTKQENTIRPNSMLGWFAGMGELLTFDGRGIDMSRIENADDVFQGIFAEDGKLHTVDIRNWDMGSHAHTTTEVRDMFKNNAALKYLIVNKAAVLYGSGISSDMMNHTQKLGSWIHEAWFGSGDEFAGLFLPGTPGGATAEGLKEFPTGVDFVTFIWDEGNLCGRFESNNNVWWRYTGVAQPDDPYLHVGLLRIGSDSQNITESIVTEFGDDLPWRKLLDSIKVITEVITGADYSGKVAVTSLEGWFGRNTLANGTFEYHTGLTTFDGSGLVLYDDALTPLGMNCTSVKGLFENATALRSLKGVNTWDTRAVQDFSYAFYNNARLVNLDIRGWMMNHVADSAMFENMFKGMGTAGMQSITLGPYAVLENTGFGLRDTSNAQDVPFLPETDGRWVMGDPLNLDPTIANTDVAWFDDTDGLVERYRVGEGSRQQDKTLLRYIHTYTWDTANRGGHFDSNRNVWWLLNFESKVLTIGVFDKNATVEYMDNWDTVAYRKDTTFWAHRVTEKNEFTPWNKFGLSFTAFRTDGTQGKVAPESLEGWFVAPETVELLTFEGGNIDTTNVTSLKNLFKGQSKLTNVSGINSWNTSNVTDMSHAFNGCSALTTITSLSNWNVEKVIDFSYMFYGVRGIDMTSGLAWKPVSATNLSYMFAGCTRIVNTNYLARWDVSNVTDFSYMFYNCTGLTTADALGLWMVALNATPDNQVNLTGMFRNATRLNFVDFTNWKMYDRDSGEIYVITTNMLANDGALNQIVMGLHGLLEGTALGYTQVGGTALASLRAINGGWTRHGSNVAWFGPTDALVSVYTPGSVFEAPENLIFTYVWRVEQTGGHVFPSNRFAWWKFMPDSGTLIIGLNDNTNNDSDYKTWVTEKWYELPWLVDITGDNEATYKRSDIKYIEFVGDLYVINPEYWFAGLENLISADLTHMKIELAGSLEGLFGTLPGDDASPDDAVSVGADAGKTDKSLNFVTGLQAWNNSFNVGADAGTLIYDQPMVNTTSLKGMFQGASSLKDLEYVIGWDLSTILDFSFMFDGCSTLNDVSQFAGWDTSSVKTMEAMFRNVSSLKRVDGVLTWNTRKCENFRDMFNGCVSVIDLDFSGDDWRLDAALAAPGGADNLTNMLANLDALRTISLMQNFVLTNTGLDISKTHKSTDGTWEQEAFGNYVAWWGNAGQLCDRYPNGTKPWIFPAYQHVWDVAEVLTYTFKTHYLGGRFESNEFAWWKYDKNGNLVISVDTDITNGVTNNTETRVWEDTKADDDSLGTIDWREVVLGNIAAPTGIYNAPDIPWLKVISASVIKNVFLQNNIALVNPAGWFATTATQNYGNLLEFDGARADMQYAVSFESMFENSAKLTRVSSGVNGWNNMSSCTSMKKMFAGCRSLSEILGIDKWDVTHVNDFSSMFCMTTTNGAAGVLGDDVLALIGKWTLGTNLAAGETINMQDMFKDLRTITSLDGLANWDTSRVSNFSGMFSSTQNDKGVTFEYKDGKLTKTAGTLGMLLTDATAVNNWDITSATTMARMFANAIRLERINISSWNMRDLDLANMFLNCASMQEITLGRLSVLENTGFGNNMYFYETHPTNATGSASQRSEVFWRDRVHNNNSSVTFGGNTWQFGYWGGAWVAEDANRSTANDYEGLNLWSGTSTNLADLYRNAKHYAPAAITTYRWGDSFYGGVFDSSIIYDDVNDIYHYYSWWRYYTSGDLNRTLIMGTIAGVGNDTTTGVVKETNTSHRTGGVNNLPWATYEDASIVSQVQHVKTGAVVHQDGSITYDSLLGMITPTTPEGWFNNYASLVSFDGSGLNTTLATSLAYFLSNNKRLTTISGMGDWDVDQVVDFSYMFYGDSALKDISTLRTWVLGNSNSINMEYMFAGTGIADLLSLAYDAANNYWNTSHVSNMEGMFQASKLVNQEGISDWDVSRVENMRYMFKNAAALTTVNLSRWAMRTIGSFVHYTANINVDDMFLGCSSLGQMTLGEASILQGTAFNNSLSNHGPTDNETGGMWELVKADGVDLPRTSHNTAQWFGSTGSLAERYKSTGAAYAQALTYVWRSDMIGERFESNPFAWWTYDKNGNLVLGLDTGAEASIYAPKPGDTKTAIDYNNTVTETQCVTTDGTETATLEDLPWLYSRFNESNSVTEKWGTYNPTTRASVITVTTKGGILLRFPQNWFMNYANLITFDGSGMDVPQATSLANFFRNDAKLVTFTTSANRWNTSNITNISYFMYGTAITSLEGLQTAGTNGWDVSHVVDMTFAFANMTKLTDISGLANWKTTSSAASPLNMTNMLSGCTALVDASPLKDWVVTGANLTNLFYNNTALTTIDIHLWDMRDATVTNMFYNNRNLGNKATGGYIRLGAKTKLTDTAINSIATRMAKLGSWVRILDDPIAWFGTGNSLIRLYLNGSTGLANTYLTPGYIDYYWDPTFISGRFESNESAWWIYFLVDTTYDGEDMKAGTLLLGADKTATNLIVTETADELPWLDDPSTAAKDQLVAPTQIKYVKTKYDIAPTTPKEWFKDYTSIITFDGSGMKITNGVTSLEGMFARSDDNTTVSSLTTVSGVDKWDVTGLTSIKSMFRNANALTTLEGFASWANKLVSLADMSYLFYKNTSLTNDSLAELATWNVSNVSDMSYFLAGCTAMKTLDNLAAWRPAKVQVLDYAFQGMTALTSIEGLRNWNPGSDASVTAISMEGAFSDCTALTTIEPITGSSANTSANHWDVRKVNNFSKMFYQMGASNAMKITTIDLSQWNMRTQSDIKLTDMLAITKSGTGKTNFVSYIFGPNNLLWISDTNNVGINNATLMSASDGVWIKNTDTVGLSTTIGNSIDLMKRYATTSPALVTTYTWDSTHRGGTFEDNPNIWWTYAKQDTTSVADPSLAEKTGMIRVGLVSNAASHTTNVTANVPWKVASNNIWSSAKFFEADATNGTVAPNTMAQWFQSPSKNFVSFDGTNLDVSNVTSFYRTFYNATGLVEVKGVKDWDITHVTTFQSMFEGASALQELDLTNWNMRAGNATRTSMFAGCLSLMTFTISPNVILEGTGLTEVTTLNGEKIGFWYIDEYARQNRYGTTETFANKHFGETSYDATGVHTYYWYYGAEFENPNAWWKYDRNTHTLSMGLYDYSDTADHMVTEYGSKLPWFTATGALSVPIVEVQHIVTNFGMAGEDGGVCDGTNGIQVRDFSNWFAGFTGLLDFDGRGLDVSNTYFFNEAFKGDTRLEKIDISTWNMVLNYRFNQKDSDGYRSTWPVVTSMLEGCTSISRIVAGNDIYLVGSGLVRDGGLWAAGEFTHDNEYTDADTLWFDTTEHLFTASGSRYMANVGVTQATGRALGEIEYVFVPSAHYGVFPSNVEATWIIIDKDFKLSDTTTLQASTIYIGARPSATNKKVTAFNNSNQLPWLDCDFKHVRTFGGMAPSDVRGWFAMGDGELLTSQKTSFTNWTYKTLNGSSSVSSNSIYLVRGSVWHPGYYDSDGVYHSGYYSYPGSYISSGAIVLRAGYYYTLSFRYYGSTSNSSTISRYFGLTSSQGSSSFVSGAYVYLYGSNTSWTDVSVTFYISSTGNYYLSTYDTSAEGSRWTFSSLSLRELGIKNIETFDGTGWNVSSTSYYNNMFRKSKNLKSVDIHNWDMNASTANYENMLDGTTSLTRLDLGPDTNLPSAGTSSTSWYITTDNWESYNNGTVYGVYSSNTDQYWTIRRSGTTPIRLYFASNSGLYTNAYIRIYYGIGTSTYDRSPLILTGTEMAGKTYTFDCPFITIWFDSNYYAGSSANSLRGFSVQVSYGDLYSTSGTRAIDNVKYGSNPYTVGWVGPVANNAIWGAGTWVEHSRDGAYDELTRKEAPWFGTSPNLLAHHNVAANKGKYTYIWDPNFYGDRINCDDHLWWYYRADGHTREDGYVVKDNSLVIGADPGYAGKTININRDTLTPPWEMAVPSGKVQNVATIGRWKAPTLKSWFSSSFFSNLVTFDGSGIDVSATTTIAYIFQNRTKLKELNLRGWSIKPSVTIDGAFSSLSALERLIMDNGTSLTTSPSLIGQIPGHANGVWVATNVTEDDANPKLDSGANYVYEGLYARNTSPSSSTDRSLEVLYGYTNAGNDHGIVTWDWRFGTIVSFRPNHSSATGNIPDIFLNGGETINFYQGADGKYYVEFPNGTIYEAYVRDGYILDLWNTEQNLRTDKHGNPVGGTQIRWGGSYTAPNRGDSSAVSVTFWAQWIKDADITVKFVVDTTGSTSASTSESMIGSDNAQGYLEITGLKVGDTIKLFNGTQAGLSVYDSLANAILDMTSFVEFSRPGYDLIGWTYYMRHISSGGDTVTRAYQIYFDRENSEIRLFWPPSAADSATFAIDTFYALWAPKVGYTIEYMAPDSSYKPNNRTNLSYVEVNLLPTDASKVKRPGYKLAGWYVLDAQGNRITLPDGSTLITSQNQGSVRLRDIALSADVADIIRLYAEWEEDNITLTFKSNTEENTVGPTTQAPLLSNGDGVRNVGVIVAKGYHFVSWTNNRTGDVFTNSVLTADQIRSVAFINGNWNPTVFTANFAPNEYTIVFKPGTAAGPTGTPDKVANGDGNIADMTATYGVAFRAPAAGDTSTFWLDGYVFDGWMTDEPYNESNPSTPRKIAAGQTIYDLLAAHGGTITFTAMWRPQTIKVTWIAGEGGKVCVNGDEAHQSTSITKSYTTISPSIDIVRPVADEGYRFVEWRVTGSNETLTTEALLKLVKDGEFWPLSQSFTAIFRPITYTIAYDFSRGDDRRPLATGTMPASQTKTFGVDIRLANILDADGL